MKAEAPRSLGRSPARAGLAACAVLALAAGFALFGCATDSPTGPGAGGATELGLSANPSDFEFPDSIGSALLTARATGATMMHAGVLWTDVESSPGAVDVTQVRQMLSAFQSLGFATSYSFRVVDTNQRGTPADLAGLAWDDPTMIARVDAVVDSLLGAFAQYPLLAFSFGNEVDVYFSFHPLELPAFRALLQRERQRMRARLPGLPVGACTTSPVGNPNAWVGDTLNAYTDLSIYTYYPFQPGTDFIHRPPSTFEPDMNAMLTRASAHPLALQEVGYSSASVCGSSQAAQADFARRFRAWVGAQSRSRVLFASWFLMTDWSNATLNRLFTYYGGYSPGFGGYLGGLGLRDTTGAPKAAWNTWRGL